MAPKNKSESKLWDDQQTIDLWAHLDFILETSPGSTLTGEQAAQHKTYVLRELKKVLEPERTEDSIDRRLYAKFSEGEHWARHNFSRIFVHGSAEIHTFDEETRARIRLAIDNIRLRTPRKRRAERPCSLVESKSKIKKEVEQNTPTKSRLQKRKLLVSSRSISRSCTPFKSPSQTKTIAVSRTKRSKVSTRDPLRALRTPEPSCDRNTRATSTLSYISNASESHKETPSLSREACERQSPIPNGLGSALEATPVSGVPREVYDEVYANYSHWRERCEEIEQQCERLKGAKRDLEALTRKGNLTTDVMKELEKKNSIIAVQKKRLHDWEKLHPYIALGRGDIGNPIANDIYTTFHELKAKFDSLSLVRGIEHLRSIPTRKPSTDLESLVVGVFGEGARNGRHEVIEIMRKFPVNAIIRALTSVAVGHWVFHQKIDCADMKSTRLLQKYRTHIETICGPLPLRNLDLAAHRSIVEEQFFQDEVIPRIASRHLERMMNALRPFIQESSYSETFSRIQDFLEPIFTLAVKVKAFTLGSKDTYEDIVPIHRSPFDESMEFEQLGSNPDLGGTNEMEHREVKLTLAPGLRVYCTERGLVDYYGFSNDGEEFLGSPKLIAKAIVLL